MSSGRLAKSSCVLLGGVLCVLLLSCARQSRWAEFDVLETVAQNAIKARDAAREVTAKVLDDAIAGLQELRNQIGVPKDPPVT